MILPPIHIKDLPADHPLRKGLVIFVPKRTVGESQDQSIAPPKVKKMTDEEFKKFCDQAAAELVRNLRRKTK